MNYFIILISLFLFGCKPSTKKAYALETLSILSTQQMNQNSVVKVDLIQVFHPNLWDKLSKMKGNEYFRKKKNLLTYNSQYMKTWSFEPLPRAELQEFYIQNWSCLCVGSIVFLSYHSGEKNSFIVPTRTKHLHLSLGINALEAISSTEKVNKKLVYRKPSMGEKQ